MDQSLDVKESLLLPPPATLKAELKRNNPVFPFSHQGSGRLSPLVKGYIGFDWLFM